MSRHDGYELGRPTAFEAGPRDGQFAHIDRLMRAFSESTALQPGADLSSRILGRIAEETPSTAPGRLLAALRAFDLHGIRRGVAQSARAVVDPGTRSVVLRVQALTLVILVVGTSALGSAAAVAATARVVVEVRDRVVARPTLESPSDPVDRTRSVGEPSVTDASAVQGATVRVPVRRRAGSNEPPQAARAHPPKAPRAEVQPPALAVDVPSGPQQKGKSDPPGRSGDKPTGKANGKADGDPPAGQKAKGKGKGLADRPGRSEGASNRRGPAGGSDRAHGRSGSQDRPAHASGGNTDAHGPAAPNAGANGQGRADPPGRSASESADGASGDTRPGPRRNGKRGG